MIQGVFFCSEGEVKKCVKAVVIMLLDFSQAEYRIRRT